MLKWLRSRKHWYRPALPLYWILLFSATHYPKVPLPAPIPQTDKVVHFAAFGLLAFLLWKCVESFDRQLSGRFVWIAWVVLGAYAALDEYLQQFVNRQTSLADWLADLAGISSVLLVLEVHRRRRASATRGDPAAPDA
jgi:VanZ family protein